MHKPADPRHHTRPDEVSLGTVNAWFEDRGGVSVVLAQARSCPHFPSLRCILPPQIYASRTTGVGLSKWFGGQVVTSSGLSDHLSLIVYSIYSGSTAVSHRVGNRLGTQIRQ